MPYSGDAAQAAHCWFAVDRVTGSPETTDWKRHARFGQAEWRLARDYPIGAHPYDGGPKATPVGSRLELGFAIETGSNFLTAGALAAVRARLAAPEQHQLLNAERLWADLLSSLPLCFNLFGELWADADAAARAVRAWWPDAPKGPVQVRFEHSPGRRDPAFLGNQSAFDAAFEIVTGKTRAIVGVGTKYHEHALLEKPPRAEALARYVDVSERAGIFASGWQEAIVGTALQQIWLDHLLVLSMLQHPSRKWTWGRFVLVYPEHNPSFVAAASAYRALLVDDTTFEPRTLESLVETSVTPMAAFRERYLGG
jgi:hypothetical protein